MNFLFPNGFNNKINENKQLFKQIFISSYFQHMSFTRTLTYTHRKIIIINGNEKKHTQIHTYCMGTGNESARYLIGLVKFVVIFFCFRAAALTRSHM